MLSLWGFAIRSKHQWLIVMVTWVPMCGYVSRVIIELSWNAWHFVRQMVKWSRDCACVCIHCHCIQSMYWASIDTQSSMYTLIVVCPATMIIKLTKTICLWPFHGDWSAECWFPSGYGRWEKHRRVRCWLKSRGSSSWVRRCQACSTTTDLTGWAYLDETRNKLFGDPAKQVVRRKCQATEQMTISSYQE